MNLLCRIRALAGSVWMRSCGKDAGSGPVYVFHHIPKCGGSSLLKALASWFVLVKDYRPGWEMKYPVKTRLETLTPWHCLCGHFEEEGYRLGERYPDLLVPGRYRLFTFVRDPLMVKLSLYRYERENNVPACSSVEECLLTRPNYMAAIFQATETNYREILDRYFFVGILESAQKSLDLLAVMIGRQTLRMPRKNSTRTTPGTGIKDLSPELTAKFREANHLDYMIYEYCVERFRESCRTFDGDAGPGAETLSKT